MSLISGLVDKIVKFIGNVSWTQKNPLTLEEKQQIRELLKNDYYIILTRGNNHLSTYAISFANFILTGKFSYWAHALMNFEDSVETDDDFRLMQATRAGVHYTTFDEVFNTNSIVLLQPSKMEISEWTDVLDKAKTYLGKPYDTLYDIANDNALSCVELVRDSLKADEKYSENFADFERLISRSSNLTPEMFYKCADFKVALEIRHK